MGKLKYLVIHCTSTPEGKGVTVNDIKNWHMGEPPSGKGWSKVGYSDMIHVDGSLSNLTPYNQDGRVDGWGLSYNAEEINTVSRHIVYVGGVSKDRANAEDTRNDAQKETLSIYIKYMIKRHPDILISGHNQFSDKSCPSFNVAEWLRSIGIEEKNIFTP